MRHSSFPMVLAVNSNCLYGAPSCARYSLDAILARLMAILKTPQGHNLLLFAGMTQCKALGDVWFLFTCGSKCLNAITLAQDATQNLRCVVSNSFQNKIFRNIRLFILRRRTFQQLVDPSQGIEPRVEVTQAQVLNSTRFVSDTA